MLPLTHYNARARPARTSRNLACKITVMRRSNRNTAKTAHAGLSATSSNSKRAASPMKDTTSSKRVKRSLDPPQENSPLLPDTEVERVVARNDERLAEEKWQSWLLLLPRLLIRTLIDPPAKNARAPTAFSKRCIRKP